MGILTMFGLVTAEEHAKLDALFATVAKERNEALIAVSDAELKLKAGKTEMERLARGWDKCGDDLKIMKADRDKAVRDYSEMSGIVSERDAEIVRLRAEVDDLKPDAEKFRARRASAKAYDENRRKKAEAPAAAKPVSKFTKPIPAPKTKTAAKKAVRK